MNNSLIIQLFTGALLLLSFTRCNNAGSSMSPVSDDSDDINRAQAVDRYLPMLADTVFTAKNTDTTFTGQEGLLYMREEEKLAHDVYVYLYAKWNRGVFNNISNSEQRHIEAMKYLLSIYNIEDPADGNMEGQFVNTRLQDLYNQLTAQGSISLIEALKVGAAIEEIDILDIKKEVETDANYADIVGVYSNLMSASENHLRAFIRNLAKQGVVYKPEHLTDEEYKKIIN